MTTISKYSDDLAGDKTGKMFALARKMKASFGITDKVMRFTNDDVIRARAKKIFSKHAEAFAVATASWTDAERTKGASIVMSLLVVAIRNGAEKPVDYASKVQGSDLALTRAVLGINKTI